LLVIWERRGGPVKAREATMAEDIEGRGRLKRREIV